MDIDAKSMDISERKRRCKEECDIVMLWSIEEDEKTTERLKKEGRVFGLDGNNKEYQQTHNEAKSKIRAIRKKYGFA